MSPLQFMSHDLILACEECNGETFRITTRGALYCATCDLDGSGDYGLMVGHLVKGDLIDSTPT